MAIQLRLSVSLLIENPDLNFAVLGVVFVARVDVEIASEFSEASKKSSPPMNQVISLFSTSISIITSVHLCR